MISLLETRDEGDVENATLDFIEDHTTAEETPNCFVRLVLMLICAEPDVFTDGTIVEFLEYMEELIIYEPWCTKEEFKAAAKLIKQGLLLLDEDDN